MARIAAINISEVRGVQKHEVPEAFLQEGWGIEGDAHGGNWHRQVSLLGADSVAAMQEKLDFTLEHGAFAENILVEGMTVHTLPIGTKLKIGEALAEVTQIGKECHADCVIREKAGDCVMPREGIFVKVLSSGRIRTGDNISIREETGEDL
ncbi:MAG: MOSC domain-containing protein [Clostridia bacterium]|nr:MOSC domain-containing protein [Clostridia bacterium]MBR5753463.1 MOSC domain-containing protein [Clostridia bacterium]